MSQPEETPPWINYPANRNPYEEFIKWCGEAVKYGKPPGVVIDGVYYPLGETKSKNST